MSLQNQSAIENPADPGPLGDSVSSRLTSNTIQSEKDEKLQKELETVLKGFALGDVVLTSRGKPLTFAVRSLLVDMLAEHLIRQAGGRPCRSEYEKTCRSIVAMFPNEQESTYYIPSLNGSMPRGKLYAKVSNIICKKRSLGGTSQARPRPQHTGDGPVWDFPEEGDVSSLQEAIDWLMVYQQPESRLLEYWKKTCRSRLNFIHSSNGDPNDKVTLQEVLNKWPRYKDRKGNALIALDFATMYPNKCDGMSSWPSIANKTLKLLHKSKDRLLVKMLAAFIPEAEQSTDAMMPNGCEMRAALILLPFLFPEAAVSCTTSGKRKRRSYYKPSVVESQEWFIDVQKPGLDISHHLTQKGQLLQQKNAGSFGPHVLVLSDDETKDNKIFAVIQGNFMFECQSVVDAVDTCLKASFVFGLSFPLPARSTWTFVQKLVYDISTDVDFNSTRLSEMMSFLRS